MSFTFHCPHCKAEISAEESWIGCSAPCPACGKQMTVEKDTVSQKVVYPSPVPSSTPPPHSGTFIFHCASCQAEISAEESWIGRQAACPACGKQMTVKKDSVSQEVHSSSTPPPHSGTFIFHCASCQAEISAEEAWRGKIMNCPSCGAKNRIPMEGETPPSQAEPDFLFICPECDSPAMLPATKQGKTHTCQFCNEDVIALPSTTRKCPFCGETIKIAATICKSCRQPVPPIMPQEPMTARPHAASSVNHPYAGPNRSTKPYGAKQSGPGFPANAFGVASTRSSSQFVPPQGSSGLAVTSAGEGKFTVYGSYAALWECAQQAMLDCGVEIKENNPQQGRLAGKAPYGVNLFGMTVTACMYTDGSCLVLEFSASFTDAFDTMGGCSKKVQECSHRFQELASSFVSHSLVDPAAFPEMPPDASCRVGQSYANKAMTAFYEALGGFALLWIINIGGAIVSGIALAMAIMALVGMKRSNNPKGKGFAIAAIAIAGFTLLLFLG